MAKVTLSSVKKNYGPIRVIHGVDMEIKDGEFIVIVGPSGCGKSTLLRMIAGLEAITDGTIAIGERVVNNIEPRDRDIAMVFQNYALYPHMSVYENMSYGLRIRGMSKDEIAKRVSRAADILQLQPYLQRRPRELSGGQRQRVAMGRAIVREPSVFLFDEPLSNLDAKLRVQMRLEIKRLHQQLGVTSVYVTHDQVEAMTLADRLIVMNQGRAEQIGTPAQVYSTPATTYVGGFIGSPPMNFLSCEVAGGQARLPDGTLLPLPAAYAGAAAGSYTLGIRPEHMRPVLAGETGHLALNVDVAEELGADTLLHGKVGTEEVVARVPSNAGYHDASTPSLLIDTTQLHLFDKASGARIGA
ncbi:sn-glycerol-3-phosphate import ATP-binding protein UgpC [Ferrovibrio sp.]|uniref:sn-glycerol-3-phosphate import ATP-binding protein UgpC n=1 Tax=Ferrovibrio sp. TaxID=1917215 RepID=UPI001B6FD604|nr:sn-glycerol-3-phosphate import ATP-binding protein UgpC [Ferrovibrio sp.]MBP7064913.1 sn-glycerol-3-phosphate import ATP-binding protein UgpC [Ferrovibrio sp.]